MINREPESRCTNIERRATCCRSPLHAQVCNVRNLPSLPRVCVRESSSAAEAALEQTSDLGRSINHQERRRWAQSGPGKERVSLSTPTRGASRRDAILGRVRAFANSHDSRQRRPSLSDQATRSSPASGPPRGQSLELHLSRSDSRDGAAQGARTGSCSTRNKNRREPTSRPISRLCSARRRGSNRWCKPSPFQARPQPLRAQQRPSANHLLGSQRSKLRSTRK
jgi:hypothetical protein